MSYIKNIVGFSLALSGAALVVTVATMSLDAASLAGAFMVAMIGTACAFMGIALIQFGKGQ